MCSDNHREILESHGVELKELLEYPVDEKGKNVSLKKNILKI